MPKPFKFKSLHIDILKDPKDAHLKIKHDGAFRHNFRALGEARHNFPCRAYVEPIFTVERRGQPLYRRWMSQRGGTLQWRPVVAIDTGCLHYAFMTVIVARDGAPRQLRSDAGTNVASVLCKVIYEECGVDLSPLERAAAASSHT